MAVGFDATQLDATVAQQRAARATVAGDVHIPDAEPAEVLIGGQCYLYQQKAPFVRSGESTFGALEYHRSADQVKCHECGKWFDHVGLHVVQAHGMSAREYKHKHGLKQSSALCGERLRSLQIRNLKRRPFTRQDVEKALAVRAAVGVRKGLQLERRNIKGACQAQLIARLRALAATYRRWPSEREILAAGMSPASVSRALNVRSTRELASLLGFEARIPNKTVYASYTPELLIHLLQQFHAAAGRCPSESDMRRGLLPGRVVFNKFFGNLRNALALAGLLAEPSAIAS